MFVKACRCGINFSCAIKCDGFSTSADQAGADANVATLARRGRMFLRMSRTFQDIVCSAHPNSWVEPETSLVTHAGYRETFHI